jgi:hypothetical protein
MIYLFREPGEGEQVIIGCDPAEGGDNSAWVALSKKHDDVVMASQSKEESSQLGYSLNHIGKWLHKKTGIYPCIAVERNVGQATLAILKELNYPEIYRMPEGVVKTEGQEPGERYGWVTTISSRPKLLDDLALAIRQKSIKIPDERIVSELFTFIRNKRTGKPEADRGSHDDMVFALGIALQALETAPPPVEPWDQAAWDAKEAEERKRMGDPFY